MKTDDLTVIVVSYNSRKTLGSCLDSLLNQTARGFRTLVVDSSTDGSDDIVEREYGLAELVRSSQRLFPGDARNLGMRRVVTPLVAFVDADCIAASDWVERIVAAHDATDLIIGGSIGVANPASVPGWALYFCEFSGWLPLGKIRTMSEIPTCCLSFKRAAFDSFGPFLERSYCSDTLFNWKAGKAGHPPLFVPEIHVRHQNPTAVGYILGKLRMHGETFGRVRAQFWQWGWMMRKTRSASWILLPPWLWLRTAWRVMGAPEYRWRFLRATPLILAGFTCWSWGEAVAYWNSEGTA
jgi:GT2 family glycosyltransferase